MDEKKGVELTIRAGAGVVSFQDASISDVEEINSLSDKIAEYVDKNRPSKLIFDFKHVKFFSSQVLGMLLSMRAKLSANEGEVLISSINPQLHRVFRITNLDKIFRFFPDVESAINTTKTKSED
jgi:anti-anti-sigma factor